jgi:hypothetical protein
MEGMEGYDIVNFEAIIGIFSLGMFECASVDVSRRGYFTEKDVRGLKVYWNRIRFVHLLPGRVRFGHAFLDAVQASGRCIDISSVMFLSIVTLVYFSTEGPLSFKLLGNLIARKDGTRSRLNGPNFRTASCQYSNTHGQFKMECLELEHISYYIRQNSF